MYILAKILQDPEVTGGPLQFFAPNLRTFSLVLSFLLCTAMFCILGTFHYFSLAWRDACGGPMEEVFPGSLR